jgi:hypothetical protein
MTTTTRAAQVDAVTGRSPGVVAIVAVLAAASATAACGGQTGGESTPDDASDHGDTSTTGDGGEPTDGTVPGDAGTPAPVGDCGPPASGLNAYASAASGTIAASGVSVSICNAEAYVFLSRYTTPPGDYLFNLASIDNATSFEFAGDAGAANGLLSGMVLVSAPGPGTYTSTGTSSCGFLGFSYSLPLPPGIDCEGGVAPDCPPGCGSACSGQGCLPCSPMQPEVFYQANAPSDCLGDSQNVTGSWSLTLTSVAPAGTQQNGTYYVPHGTITATLTGGNDAGTDTVTMSMAF